VEQRLDAVRAVLGGASVTEVAAAVGVSRVSVHAWLQRYLAEGVAGLADRSHRPRSSPGQASDAVAVAVTEMRRQHPRWVRLGSGDEMNSCSGPTLSLAELRPYFERHLAELLNAR
jgi:transposase